MKYLDKILDSGKTVFRYNDIEILLGISNRNTLKSFFLRGSDDGIFKNIQNGIYTLKKYDIFELGTKLKSNSYISLETVLKQQGVIFQDYGKQIFLVSDNTIEKQADTHSYKYHKIKASILLNPIGVIHRGNYIIASKERAICDKIYLSKNYYFDNIDDVDWENIVEISHIYNKRVVAQVLKLKKSCSTQKDIDS